MNRHEKLLGYDAREMRAEIATEWTPSRRSTYLLRHDVEKPLSTDVLVWPSVVDLDSNDEGCPYVNSLRLWNSLFQLKECLQASEALARKPFWIVGITLLSNALNEHEQALWTPRLPLTEPSVRAERWSFLGYDISDLALLSGLSNCGYNVEELPTLKERWGPHLNRFHLFTEEGKALEFKIMTDERVPEHSPFFVYGLYLVERS